MSKETENKAASIEAASTEASKSNGLVEFEFTVDHGTRQKGDKVEMHLSTAKALAFHKKGKVGKKVTFKAAIDEK